MKKLSIFLSLLFLAGFGFSQPNALQHFNSWNEVVQKAQMANKLIFVDVYFTGCFPCEQMDKKVFPNPNIQEILNENFVAMKTDILKEALGDSLVRKYQVSGFPTYLILSAQGDLINSISGFADIDVMMRLLENSLEMHKQKKYLTGFSRGLSVHYPQPYLDFYSKERKPVDAEVANAWIRQNEKAKPEAAAMLFLVNRNPDTDLTMQFLDNFNQFKALYGQELAIKKAENILNGIIRNEIKSRDDQQFLHVLEGYRPKFESDDWRILKLLLASNYYQSIAKDDNAFLQFMAANPVFYKNYYGAALSRLIVKKDASPDAVKALATWGADAIDDNTSSAMIEAVANAFKLLGDEENYQKYKRQAADRLSVYTKTE